MVDTKTSEDEKNAALSFSLSLRILTAITHASLRAHCSCFKVSSSDLSSNFGAYGHHAHENRCAESHLVMDPFLSRNFTWRCVPHENCTLRFSPEILCPSVKSTWISAARHPGNATQLPGILQQGNRTFSTILVRSLVRLTVNLSEKKKITFHPICIPILFRSSDTGGCQ